MSSEPKTIELIVAAGALALLGLVIWAERHPVELIEVDLRNRLDRHDLLALETTR